jgi:hypothetical protein
VSRPRSFQSIAGRASHSGAVTLESRVNETAAAACKTLDKFHPNEINQYYPMAKEVAGLPVNYIGGYFWWYFAEEMVPWPGSLGYTLNTAIQ